MHKDKVCRVLTRYVPCAIFLLLFVCSLYLSFIINIYIHEKIYRTLYTTFFTIGALLITLQSYIVSFLQKNIYDNQEYQEKKLETFGTNGDLNIYIQLQRIIYIFVCTIKVLFVVGFINFLVEFTTIDYYLYLSVSSSAIAIYFIGLSVFIYGKATNDLIKLYSVKNEKIILLFKNRQTTQKL